MVFCLNTLGDVACALMGGTCPEGRSYYRQGLQVALQAQIIPAALRILASVAALEAREGQVERAAALGAFVLQHPSTIKDTRDRLERLLSGFESHLPASVLAAAQARGQARKLEDWIAEILTIGEMG